MSLSPFRAKIREKIADQALQAALDANAARRVKGRLQAFASLPDWPARRQRAHAVRAEVIEHLDEYLERFIARVGENGIIVHRAKDATEAVNLCLDIIGNSPNRKAGINTADSVHPREKYPIQGFLVAKSKSMVSEEINLNHALEEAGHRVVETDLGEYIVQLRAERPSHIITPAVHMRRHEVGELFHDKLKVPYTEDVPTLTETARRVLRDVFLNADVGVSGVNFGVAETGTLTIVTNEGNGRMVTTLPRVHIALMGMERLVRNLDDLALMLSLLPRSATSQKLSVYTQLIQRPEAGQRRHLIILDNRRSRLQRSHLQEALFCIRCGACLNACPVFRELGGHGYIGAQGSIAPYPGPIGSVVSPGLLGEDYVQLAQASSLCGACKEACPVDIDLPRLLTRVRAGESPAPVESPTGVLSKGTTGKGGAGLSATLKLGLHTYTYLATHPRLFAIAQRAAALGSRLVSPFSAWIRLPAFTGWGFSKDFPRPAARPFRAQWQALAAVGTESIATPPEKNVPEEAKKPLEKQEHLLERFVQELADLGGHVHQTSEKDLGEAVIVLLRTRGLSRIQAWEHIYGLDLAALTEAGLQVQHEPDATIRAGLTGAMAGIADTGTLVIPGGQGQPLSASLLPEIHIAVLLASDLLPSLEAAMQIPGITTSPGTVLVNGPSRTADIEMTLTIGVHGPAELHVFIIE